MDFSNLRARLDSIPMDNLQIPSQRVSRTSSISSVASSWRGPMMAVEAKSVSYLLNDGFQMIPILDRLNLTVEVGTIYGLLGPSGCGKTTFLRCLIGFQQVTSGHISVFGFAPRDERSGVPGRGLGYMPQDLALHEYLTIEEELTYFGNLYMIDSDVLKKRIDRLVASLELPEKTRLLVNLSGGQRRRVSFALTIVHKPRLLILDEPTVGCDPVLRERIWESLVHFSKTDRISVIITTHYIEEARRSHRVGFMRCGSILMEDSPHKLMERMGCDTLEKVFLQIVMSKEKKDHHPRHHASIDSTTSTSSSSSADIFPQVRSAPRLSEVSCIYVKYQEPMPRIAVNFEAKFMLWYYFLIVIIQNISIQIKRTPTVIIVQFVIPLISLMCFCMFIGHTPNGLRIGVINDERPMNLSYDLIDSVNKFVLKMIPYDDMDQVIYDAKRQRIYGWVHFKENFTQAIIERYTFPEIYLNSTQSASTVDMHLDVTHWPLSITVRRAFQEAFINFLSRMMVKLGKNPQIAQIPVAIPEILYGSMEQHDYSGFREFVSIGILVIMSYTIAFGVTILVVLQEKTSLIFERNYAAGVSTSQLIFGHLITRFVVQSLVVFILFIMTLTLFDVSQKGSYITSLALLLTHSLTGACHGIYTSAQSESLFFAAIASNAILIFFFVIGGILWPYESLPYFLKWIAMLSPTCMPTESLRGVLVRGWGFMHPSVINGFAVAFVWAMIFLIGSLTSFRYGVATSKRQA
ncbi:ABC transporter G family member 23-like [Brevipalpus obovatus]|uniref:ABC transporter G family member 23-like n=1 Tax=Brevipalpus obovatus TaxID=246614 RepID=UPI003D9F363C